MNDPDLNGAVQTGRSAQGAWVASLPKSAPAAIYFDGMTNRKHNVALRFGSALGLVEDGMFEAAIQPSVAVFGQTLWNPDRSAEELIHLGHSPYYKNC